MIETHNIDFEKIRDIFGDTLSINFVDYEHSDENETRYGIIGKTAQYGLIILYYTEIDEITVKFITARRAEKWMVRLYEKQRYR